MATKARDELIAQFAQRARGEAQQRNRSSAIGNLNRPRPLASINRPGISTARVGSVGPRQYEHLAPEAGAQQKVFRRNTQAGSARAGMDYATFTKKGPGGAVATYHEYRLPSGKRQVVRVGASRGYM